MARHSSGNVQRQSGPLTQIEEAIALAKAGDRSSAATILRRIIHRQPENEEAWLWLAWVSEDGQQKLDYLREAHMLLPGSERISEAMRWAERDVAAEPPSSAEGRDALSSAGAEMGASAGRQGPLASLTQQLGLPGGEPSGRGTRQHTRPGRAESDTPALSDDYAAGGGERLLAPLEPGRQWLCDRMLWLRGRARTAELPEVDWDRLQMVAAVVVAMVAVSTLAVLIGVAVTSGRGRPLVVQAWTLPTRVPDATPTPSPSELAAPLIQEADAAIVNGDWKTAVELLGQAHKLDRRDAETRDRLAEACYEYGCALVDENRLEEAQVELDWAIRLDATNDELQHMRRQLKLYREAIDAYWAQDWQEVIDALQKVQKMAPEFRDTSSMLAESYVQRAMELQEAESYDEALEMYDLALEINPDMAEASARIAEVQEILVPAHRIEVDLSEQKVWVYEEHQVIREFIVCTGREGAPTKPGRYTILDKMPMAYASKWDLDMPWWLGIYWAGGSQNGFHALPYLSNGQILWRGYLGTRCSFGCIVLDTDDAKWLYDWAEEGDVVIVRR